MALKVGDKVEIDGCEYSIETTGFDSYKLYFLAKDGVMFDLDGCGYFFYLWMV